MKIISFKVTDDISDYLNTKANKSEYIRRLIIDDMNNGTEKRIIRLLHEYLGHCKEMPQEDISKEIDSILNM